MLYDAGWANWPSGCFYNIVRAVCCSVRGIGLAVRPQRDDDVDWRRRNKKKKKVERGSESRLNN